MKLIHTLLLLIRQNKEVEDLTLLSKCLKSLEKSRHRTVLIYNQGYWTNDKIKDFLRSFDLDCIVIGDAANVGIVEGRQACFKYIWETHPETKYISELHLDMIFTHNWEDPLIDYLETHDEPVISCGIVDKVGSMAFANKRVEKLPADPDKIDEYLSTLTTDSVKPGFTHPCIHNSSILKEVGGYNTHFLVGKQIFEDDSLLLGYFYYYGTKNKWQPKVCYKSMVYHAIAAQRLGVEHTMWQNFQGLVKQYGAMGLKHLSQIHTSSWHIKFFSNEFNKR